MQSIILGILVFILVVLAATVSHTAAGLFLILVLVVWYFWLKRSDRQAMTEAEMLSALERGVTRAEQGNYQQAIADFSFVLNQAASLLKKFPHTYLAYFNRGNTYYLLSEFSSAIEDYDRAIQLKPGYVDGYINRGAAYGAQGNHPAAIQNYQRVLQYQPNSALAYYNWGNSCQAVGEYDQAIEHYTQAIRLNPNYLHAYDGRGFAYSYLGKDREALEDFAQVVQLQPSSDAYYNQAILQNLLNLDEQTLSSLNQAFTLNPNFVSAYYFRSNLLHRLNQQQAAQDFQQAATLEADQVDTIHPDDTHGFYQRGLARHRMGDRTGAIADLESAIQICQTLQYSTFEQKVRQTLAEIQNSP